MKSELDPVPEKKTRGRQKKVRAHDQSVWRCLAHRILAQVKEAPPDQSNEDVKPNIDQDVKPAVEEDIKPAAEEDVKPATRATRSRVSGQGIFVSLPADHELLQTVKKEASAPVEQPKPATKKGRGRVSLSHRVARRMLRSSCRRSRRRSKDPLRTTQHALAQAFPRLLHNFPCFPHDWPN